MSGPLATIGWYMLAAVGEIGGCFAFWAVLRLDKSPLWLVPGALALAFFAYALTRVEADAAGRAFAAYGGKGGLLFTASQQPPASSLMTPLGRFGRNPSINSNPLRFVQIDITPNINHAWLPFKEFNNHFRNCHCAQRN